MGWWWSLYDYVSQGKGKKLTFDQIGYGAAIVNY